MNFVIIHFEPPAYVYSQLLATLPWLRIQCHVKSYMFTDHESVLTEHIFIPLASAMQTE